MTAFQKTGGDITFVSLKGDNNIAVRADEQEVENETLSCSTRAMVAALFAANKAHEFTHSRRGTAGRLQGKI